MASVSAGASGQGFQEPAAARTTETMSSSSASPTEGGPPDLAETKDDEGRGGSGSGGDSAATVSPEIMETCSVLLKHFLCPSLQVLYRLKKGKRFIFQEK